jgi:hypothetical protein
VPYIKFDTPFLYDPNTYIVSCEFLSYPDGSTTRYVKLFKVTLKAAPNQVVIEVGQEMDGPPPSGTAVCPVVAGNNPQSSTGMYEQVTEPNSGDTYGILLGHS